MRATASMPILLAALCLPGCELGELDVESEIEIEPVAELQQGLTTRVIQEDPGRYIAIAGEDCAPVTKGVVTMQGSWVTPAYVQRATVFLNGWDVRYTSADHHVKTVGMEMKNVAFSSSLRFAAWNVEGRLHDKNGDDAAEVCYTYTAIGWNTSAIDARVAKQLGDGAHGYAPDVKLLDVSAVPTSPFGAADRVAVLPRGFSQWYAEMKGMYDPRCLLPFDLCSVDHHVLQLAYHQSQDLDAGNGIGWTARSILRDNDAKHGRGMDASAVVLGGTSVEVVVPSYSVNPVGHGSECGTVGAIQGERWVEVTVPNLPYDYVVPVLTGWNLRFECDDEHVTRAGLSIRNPTYDAATRTLRYHRVEALADQDNRPAFLADSQVVLLGFRRLPSGPKAPEPMPPLGGVFVAK